MIIEMKSLMLFQFVGLNNTYIHPRQASDKAHVTIGYAGGDGIDVYLHHWDEFVEKVHEADKVMQEAKLYYEKRISEWEDREIAAMSKQEIRFDREQNEETMNEEQQRLLWIGAFRYYAKRRFHCSFHAFCDLIYQEWPLLSCEVRHVIKSEFNLCFAHDDPEFDNVRSLWTDEGV